MNPTKMTPQEIDTELSLLWSAEQTARHRAATARRFAADKATRWPQAAEAESARADEYQAEASALREQAKPLETEYDRRGGWHRYFLVTNSNGHVHRGMNCASCYPSTTYAWLVELADCDEAEMIVEFGEKACTICFPEAPAHPAFAGPGRRDRQAVEARAAERAAKKAAKDAVLT